MFKLQTIIVCITLIVSWSAVAVAKNTPVNGKQDKVKPCAIDRMRICGTMSINGCDLKQHLDLISSECVRQMEEKRRTKLRRRQDPDFDPDKHVNKNGKLRKKFRTQQSPSVSQP